jgi:transcription antitermination factor NusG
MFAKLADSPELCTLALAATARQRANPYNAELVPGVVPHWHILRTYPGYEAIAANHLSDRLFGTYLPEFDQLDDHKRLRHLKMFPGYVLLFCWDVMRHWRRIKACTGVSSIMLDGEWPVIVPDKVVNDIQAIECNLLLNGPTSPLKKIPKLRGKRGYQREPAPPVEEGEEVIGLSTRSFLRSLADIDGQGPNRLLHKALGLAA